MNFMQDDDYLLLMSHSDYRVFDHVNDGEHILTIPERKRLYDVGIRTVSEQPAWYKWCPSPNEYDFGFLDGIINRNREAGLKSLMSIGCWRVPRWIPEDWFTRSRERGKEPEVLSLWNEEAQQWSDKCYSDVIEHYKGQNDVAFIFQEYQGGEGVWPPYNCFYDPAAYENYKNIYGSSAEPDVNNTDTLIWASNKIIDYFLRKNRIFYPQYKEIWNCQQSLMDRWTHKFGNFAHVETMKALRETFPDATIVFLQYTYFDTAHTHLETEYVDKIIELTQCETIVEAMFSKGLPETTPRSIAKGFRGQIVRPAQYKAMEDWEVENIKNSIGLWKASKEQ